MDNGTDKVYQYTAAAGRTSGSQNAAATFALAAGNTNPQDIADPPPPDMLLAPIDHGEWAFDGSSAVVGVPIGADRGLPIVAAVADRVRWSDTTRVDLTAGILASVPWARPANDWLDRPVTHGTRATSNGMLDDLI